MTERKTSLWTKILIVSVALIILMSIFSNVLVIGERLRAKHVYVEYAFYGLVIFVLAFGIIYPLVGVFFAPIFSLDKLHYEDGRARKKWCKMLVNNLIKNVELTPEEKDQVVGYLSCEDETDDKLIEFFDRKIAPQINNEIYDTAKKVMLITAISQNSVYDMLGMASANFCLVKRIVEICGFRPTTPQVMKLYLKILSYTLLAGTLEDLNIQELLPFAVEGSLGKMGGIVIASATQGALNALTTLRIAVICKNLLLNADVKATRKDIRKKSYTEASATLKDIVSKTFEDKVSNPFRSFFSSKKTETV